MVNAKLGAKITKKGAEGTNSSYSQAFEEFVVNFLITNFSESLKVIMRPGFHPQSKYMSDQVNSSFSNQLIEAD